MKDFDFGRQSEDYAAYRPGFPDSFYARLELFAPIDGSRAVDIGTGPGVIAIELALRGADVTGVDVAENQIWLATRRARELGVEERCRFLVGRAEETTLDAGGYDWVTAGQCWHWFDPRAALAEAHRLLKPGGLLVIAHFSYLTSRSEVARLTDELILKHNPTWTFAFGTGMHPEEIDQVCQGDFELVEQFCYDHDQKFSHESWRGRMRTCNGVGSRTTSAEAVTTFDRELAELLRSRGFGDPMTIEHRVWAVVAVRGEE